MPTSATQLLTPITLLCLCAATRLLAIDSAEKRAELPQAQLAKSKVFEGQILPLAEVVKEETAAADDDALKVSRVLKTDDGKVFSLVKDAASRKFFMDERLLRRPMKITAVQIPATQILVVIKAQSVIAGKLHDIDYWCEPCQLGYTEPGICKCCGSPVELRELPVEPQPSTPSR